MESQETGRAAQLPRPSRIAIAVAALALGLSHAHAQQAPQAASDARPATAANDDTGAALPMISVEGERDALAQSLNPPTTVGSKLPLTAREIPQSVSVISQEQIKEQHFDTLKDAMQYAPGVTTLQSDSDRVQYYARGFPIESYLIDGTPTYVNSSISVTAATFSPSLAMYDRVEVLTGPSGLMNGFGAPGGAVNLVRKHALDAFSASAELTGGTRGNAGATLDVGGPLNKAGTLRGRAVASYYGADGVQDSTNTRNKVLYGTIDADLTSSTLLRLGASYTEYTSNEPWIWGIYSDGTYGNLPRSHYYGVGWNRDTFRTTDVFAELHQKLGNGWTAKAVLDYTYDRSTTLQGSAFNPIDASTYIGDYSSTNNVASESKTSIDVSASGPFTLLGRTHKATIGANYASMVEHQSQYYADASDPFNVVGVDVRNIIYPEPAWPYSPDTTSRNSTYAKQYGIYGQARLSLTDPLTLVLGGRLGWYRSRFSPDPVYNIWSMTGNSLGTSGKFTGYAGLIYDLNKNWSVYGSYTSIFQPQDNLMTTSGQLIRPITGDQYEAGIKGEFMGGRYNTALAVYQINQRNRAMLDPDDPTFSHYIAVGRARTRGFELSGSGELVPGWRVYGSYTYNNSQLADANSYDTISSPFSSISPHQLFKLWTTYRLPEPLHGLTLGAGVTAVSSTEASRNGVTAYQGSYAVFDASVSYAFNKKTSLSLNARNLFDRDYFAAAYARGQPRTVLLTLRAAY
ncbi:TonB-dependent siderophore receptor [Chitinasiproducens palmae]|uniref:Outer-membrane receptor for ferric coprogen and ferric-rhodotorulic acid n=1 Tax=Chitinasiproducens palmae TaxID=1770053 RepID=A0A1H2PID8_9BURK|nr:TonB-dependent siderophore receptor [Chitinasiproducens palmae]SDV46050.1 outer-membrane receptor for ferric coprogen and ferric-rhodotorulic acid [Chitinasiproducens palmae]